MQRNDRWPEDYDPEGQRSRPTSRRNSLTRRNSARASPLNTAPNSSNTTPKRVVKAQNLDFVVTGKQIVRRCDRANSLPGTYHRRPSGDYAPKTKRTFDSPKKFPSQSSKSRDTSVEDDMSFDLSQISDSEDTHSKYGRSKLNAFATSTPKSKVIPKSRSGLQGHIHTQKLDSKRSQKSLDSTEKSHESVFSRNTFKTSSSESCRYGGEPDYSSVSPEYSGQSSVDLSPRASRQTEPAGTPRSQDLHLSSCCISSWQDCSEMENTKVEGYRSAESGEWNSFWANYNNSISKVPIKNYYDQCPTPYRTEDIDLADFDISTDGSRIRSPENIQHLNYIIRTEGLHLTPRETQNMIKCAHILGGVLTRAIERRSRERDDKLHELKAQQQPDREFKKKTMTLDLKETHLPHDANEEKRCETVMTQTDISLPNTRSAPRIFENILRQLSKSSIEDVQVVDNKQKIKEDNADDKEEVVVNDAKAEINTEQTDGVPI